MTTARQESGYEYLCVAEQMANETGSMTALMIKEYIFTLSFTFPEENECFAV